MTRIPSVSDALEVLVPAEREERRWEDVLGRAEDGAAPARSRRALVLAITLAALAVVGVAASATGTLDRFGGWVSGQFGEPAAPEAQEGFDARNREAFARFPERTKLRLLLTRTVGGERYELFGFKHGPWWCLRLVRAVKPEGPGANECVATRQLAERAAPAVVFGEALFSVRGMYVEGAFGLAESDVRAVEVVRPRSGTSHVQVENSAFLVLSARRAGTVADHPPADPVVRLSAIAANGRRIAIPFVGSLPEAPRGPSYFDTRTPLARQLPGPAAPEATASGEIGWIERREPRGERYDVARLRERRFPRDVVSARALQPDPTSPYRIIVAFTRPGGICVSDIDVLRDRPGWFGCMKPARPLMPFGTAMFADAYGPRGPHFTRVSGLVSDDVKTVVVFLFDGNRIDASLRDNAFTAEAPFREFPAKIVAYNGRGRVVALEVVPGPGKLTACPRIPARDALAPPEPYERIDLGALAINGVRIVGSRPEDVVAALGPPERVEREGPRRKAFIYGAHGRRFDRGVRIAFGYAHGRFHGSGLFVHTQNAVDPRLGRFLRLPPERLERALARTYPSRYRLEYGYGTEPGRGCVAAFKRLPRSERVTISFGLSPFPRSAVGDRPFLYLSRP